LDIYFVRCPVIYKYIKYTV